MTSILSIRNLSFNYSDKSILKDLSLELDAGQRLTIAGRSGVGKSTLLNLISGLEGTHSGEIHIDGKLATSGKDLCIPPWDRGIQMVFQDLGLWPTRSVYQNVADALKASGIEKPQIKQLAIESLKRVGLDSFADRNPGSLSGGESRRLAFARSLACKPKLLLLDEPFASLDPIAKQEGFNFLNALLEGSDTAVILVTHDDAEAIALGGNISILKQGCLTEPVATSELCASPESFSKALTDE